MPATVSVPSKPLVNYADTMATELERALNLIYRLETALRYGPLQSHDRKNLAAQCQRVHDGIRRKVRDSRERVWLSDPEPEPCEWDAGDQWDDAPDCSLAEVCAFFEEFDIDQEVARA